MRGCQDHYNKRDPECSECARFAPPLTSEAERQRLVTIERRARETVAAYLAMDIYVGSVTELHPFLDNLRIALGMPSLPDDR